MRKLGAGGGQESGVSAQRNKDVCARAEGGGRLCRGHRKSREGKGWSERSSDSRPGSSRLRSPLHVLRRAAGPALLSGCASHPAERPSHATGQGFSRPHQNAISNGTRHGNHDVHVSQICWGERLLNKGGPESTHGKGVPWIFGKSKRPSSGGQNNEGPGPMPRWQSGLPELLFTNCWAHHCVQ